MFLNLYKYNQTHIYNNISKVLHSLNVSCSSLFIGFIFLFFSAPKSVTSIQMPKSNNYLKH